MNGTTAVGFEPSAVIDEAAAFVEAEWMRLMADELSALAYLELPAAQTVQAHPNVLTARRRKGLSDLTFDSGNAQPTRRRAANVWATQRSPPLRLPAGRPALTHTGGRREQSLCDVAGPFLASPV